MTGSSTRSVAIRLRTAEGAVTVRFDGASPDVRVLRLLDDGGERTFCRTDQRDATDAVVFAEVPTPTP